MNKLDELAVMGEMVQRANDTERLAAAQKRARKARKFPANTCGASRHLHMLADQLAKGKQPFMLTEEPEHCAEDIYAVISALWEARTAAAKAREALTGGKDGN